MLPLSFAEYVSAFPDNLDKARLLNDYMYLGSFPEVVNLINNGQLDLVDDYLLGIYNTVINKDVMTRTGNSDALVLQNVSKYLIDNISRFTNTKKITDALRSGARPSAYNTVDKYLTALRDSLIFYPVDRYDIKGKRYLQTQQKYYLVDTGLHHTILGASRGDDRGHILENIVYLELLRRDNQVWVGKEDDKEIDFVTKSKSGDTAYYQVAYTTKSPDIYEREIAPLRSLSDNHPKYIITTDIETLNDHGIKQLNAIDWLLGSS
jgi:predicted AAA+ superfamily ATPase